MIAPPPARRDLACDAAAPLLARAQALGYLRPAERHEIQRGAVAPNTATGELALARWLFARGWLDGRQLVDLLEDLDRPLLACPRCSVAWWPDRDLPSPLLPAPCPRCSAPLGAYTTLPRRGLNDGNRPLPAGTELAPMAAPSTTSATIDRAVRIALHYQLISPRHAPAYLASDAPTAELPRRMLADGRLTGAACRFLERRLVETDASFESTPRDAQRAPDDDRDTLEDEVRRAGLDLGFAGDQASARRDAAAIQLLYNRGEIPYYRVLELLERRALHLDRCLSCQQHWCGAHAPGPCPVCARPVVRATGWRDDLDLAVAIPAPPRLALRWHPEAEVDTSANGDLSVTASEPASIVGRLDVRDSEIRTLVRRHFMLEVDEMNEAIRLAHANGVLLLRALAGLGFLGPRAIAFLRRALELDPVPAVRDQSMLALACGPLGYLPSTWLAEEGADTLRELWTLEAAYNAGQLTLWQLHDILELAQVRLDHCPACRIQLHSPTIRGSPRECPRCQGPCTPLYEPIADRVELPWVAWLHVVAVPATVDARPAYRPLDGNLYIGRVVRRFRLVRPERLAHHMVRAETQGETRDLEDLLFEAGCIDGTALEFLAQSRDRHASGDPDPEPGRSLADLALARDFVRPAELRELLEVPGAPDPASADPVEIGGYLHRAGALHTYQLLDLLDALHVTVLHCPTCVRQLRRDGPADLAKPLACPSCNGRLEHLTAPSGHPECAALIGPIERLRVSTVTPGQLAPFAAVPPHAHPGKVPPPITAAATPARPPARPPAQPPVAHEPARVAVPDPEPGEQVRQDRVQQARERAIHAVLASSATGELVAPTPPTARSPASAATTPSAAARPVMPRAQRTRAATWSHPAKWLVGLVAAVTLVIAVRPLFTARTRASEIDGPPTPAPAASRRVTATGLVDCDCLVLEGPAAGFRLWIDIDRDVWVSCLAPEVRDALVPLGAFLGCGQRVYVTVEGELETPADGGLGLRAHRVRRAYPPFTTARWTEE